MRMEDDDYRALLSDYGVSSSTQMDSRKAHNLIQRMEAQAISTGRWAPRNEYVRPGMATRSQIGKIKILWSKAARSPDKDLSLRRFLSNHFHIDRIEWLPIKIVPKVIRSIESMIQQREVVNE